uniref:Transmembrane protein n=1 Tax=Ditylenchus dipsaci TaxID=166011 RepID=A0A915E9Y2_9BILA
MTLSPQLKHYDICASSRCNFFKKKIVFVLLISNFARFFFASHLVVQNGPILKRGHIHSTPTIFFCIGMVVAMLIGINKCKQWELDKIGEMRRTRRVIQRITARLREKNFRTIQKARNIRKRAGSVHQNAAKESPTTTTAANTSECKSSQAKEQPQQQSQRLTMSLFVPLASGTSPPPTYEESRLDQLYYECLPPVQQQQPLAKVVVRNRRCSTITKVNNNNNMVAGTSKTSRRS